MIIKKTLFAYFCTVVIVSAESAEKDEPKCEGIHVNGKFHEKEVLAKGLNRPYQLSCYKPKNVVLFSYNTGKDADDTFEIAFIDKYHKQPSTISRLSNGFATAVNEEKQEVYFGDSKGIHSYPMKFRDLVHKGILTKIVDNHNIWYIFIKGNDIYFITYPKMRLYRRQVKDKVIWIEDVDEIQEKIFQFIIDGEGDTFFTNKTGLYRMKNITEPKIHISGNCTNFRGVALDNYGVAHFCGSNYIYTVNKKKNELEEIANIENIFGCTFDSDNNIIYSNPHQIVKLAPGNCNKTDEQLKLFWDE